MNYRNIIITIALALSAQAQAATSDTETSRNAGVCAVYLEAMGAGVRWPNKAWGYARNLTAAREAAEDWKHHYTLAQGTMKTPYIMEGDYACEQIGEPAVIVFVEQGKPSKRVKLYDLPPNQRNRDNAIQVNQ